MIHWLHVADSTARAKRLLAQKDGVPAAVRREAEQILAEAQSAASARKTADAERERSATMSPIAMNEG